MGKIDLNNLKKMNDTYSHDKGDISISRLCGVADKIFSHSKIFRIGGDEFVVILEGEDYENRDERIAGFNAEMEKIRKDDQLTPWKQISAAIGCAVFDPAADTDTEDVFRRADSIMYAKKKRMKSGKA